MILYTVCARVQGPLTKIKPMCVCRDLRTAEGLYQQVLDYNALHVIAEPWRTRNTRERARKREREREREGKREGRRERERERCERNASERREEKERVWVREEKRESARMMHSHAPLSAHDALARSLCACANI